MARTQSPDYEQRRESIVDKAAALFAQKGFHAASMSELAKVCATSKSLLYHYYSSKEELLKAVMLSHVDQLVEDVETVAAQDRPARDKLAALIRAFMSHYVGAANRQKVLLNELDNLPAEERRAVVAKQRLIIDTVQALIREVYPQDSEAEARVRTMLVFGMINWTHTWFSDQGPVSTDRLAAMAAELALGAADGSP